MSQPSCDVLCIAVSVILKEVKSTAYTWCLPQQLVCTFQQHLQLAVSPGQHCGIGHVPAVRYMSIHSLVQAQWQHSPLLHLLAS